MTTKKRCKTPDKETKENPKYICEKCGSVAEKEKHLCKPKKNIRLTGYRNL